ncbi:uncharacterized protein LOC135224252 [Macrobrachium nipponense]|uniref:uncharacterized protein LOC135224252 n=1 Tax=Macrobrachium nipponense TaxID=159736 RepID=UPI0030C81F75
MAGNATTQITSYNLGMCLGRGIDTTNRFAVLQEAEEETVLIRDSLVKEQGLNFFAKIRSKRKVNSYPGAKKIAEAVDKPTRGNNILDIVLSTEDNLLSDLSVGANLGKSDHKIISFQINVQHKKEKNILMRLDYRQQDLNKLKEYVKNLKFDENTGIDKHWEAFHEEYTEKRSRCLPLRQILRNGNPQPKWFNREIKNRLRERDRLHKSMNPHPTPIEASRHKELCRLVDKLVRNAKINEDKRVASFCKEISFFTSVFTTEDTTSIPEPAIKYEGADPLDKIFTKEDIKNKIDKLNKFKSPGPDGIHPREIKELKEEIVPHLYKLHRKSAEQRKAPKGWKLGNVPQFTKKSFKRRAGKL